MCFSPVAFATSLVAAISRPDRSIQSAFEAAISAASEGHVLPMDTSSWLMRHRTVLSILGK